jgi:hypothetical protein
LSLSASVGGGPVWADRAGVVRDDAWFTLRLGVGLGRYAALQLGLDADLERIELGGRAGVVVRPFVRQIVPYFRAEIGLVTATYLGLDWELRGGAGVWLRLSRWMAAFSEVDAVGRVGGPPSLAEQFIIGLALTAPSFWR